MNGKVFPKTKIAVNRLFKAVQRNEKSADWTREFKSRTYITLDFRLYMLNS